MNYVIKTIKNIKNIIYLEFWHPPNVSYDKHRPRLLFRVYLLEVSGSQRNVILSGSLD